MIIAYCTVKVQNARMVIYSLINVIVSTGTQLSGDFGENWKNFNAL